MAFIIIRGIKKIPIDIDEYLVRCPCCETHSWADVMIVSRYVHFYWIPFFPLSKEANIVCKKCGIKRYEIPFDSNLLNNFSEVKNKYKNPWYSYLGISVMILVFICAAIHILSE